MNALIIAFALVAAVPAFAQPVGPAPTVNPRFIPLRPIRVSAIFIAPSAAVLPNFVGTPLPTAAAYLKEHEITFHVQRAQSDKVADTVIGQRPEAGIDIARVRTVVLIVSDGSLVSPSPTAPPTESPSPIESPTQTPSSPPPTSSPIVIPTTPACGSSLSAPCFGIPGWILALIVVAIVSVALRFWTQPKPPGYTVDTELKDGATTFPGGIPVHLEMIVEPGATVFRGSIPIVKREVQHD